MTVKDKKRVSIITPLYKGERYINRLLNMAWDNSEYVPLQFILVNDSPKNGIIDEKKVKDDFGYDDLQEDRFTLTIINQKENSGIHAARVSGLEKAEGEFVLFLDQDDEIVQKAVFTLLKRIEQAGADVAAGNGYRCFFNESGVCERKTMIYSKSAVLKEVNKEKMYIFGTDMIFSPGQCLIRKSSIPETWKKRKLTVNGCDDFLLWLLMFNENKTFCAFMDNIYIHNDTAESYSASYEAMECSFYAMCDYLDATKGYAEWKTAVLRRRYNLKTQLKKKSGHRLLKTAGMLCKNADILLYTFIYKTKGYY